jgi:hypothetical protein
MGPYVREFAQNTHRPTVEKAKEKTPEEEIIAELKYWYDGKFPGANGPTSGPRSGD